MNIEHPDNWFLRKYDNGEIFGPIPFEKIREWACSAQVNPQDMLSNDKTVWTKAPMVPELAMDWLVVMGKDLLYGPTTAETLMEFVQLGEITADTPLINCANGETVTLSKTAFYQANPHPLRAKPEGLQEADLVPPQPVKGGIRLNLQKRIRELELALMEERRQLSQAEENIHRLETKVHELEQRVRDYSGFKRAS